MWLKHVWVRISKSVIQLVADIWLLVTSLETEEITIQTLQTSKIFHLLSKNLLQHHIFSLTESGSVSQNTSRMQKVFLQLNPDKMNELIIDFTTLTDGGSRKKNLDFITIQVLVRIPNEPHQVHSSMRIIGCFSCSFAVQLFLSSSSFADKKFFVVIMLPISSGAM